MTGTRTTSSKLDYISENRVMFETRRLVVKAEVHMSMKIYVRLSTVAARIGERPI